jgi:tRNA pseudouridine32 synthase/23S rRNA pseudouridine746 synthase
MTAREAMTPRETMTPQEMIDRLLYRDGLMLVVDKPAGLPVHRGPKGGENLEDHFDALRFGLPRPPALAHRLDRDTSGCLVLGRHRKALERLGKLFHDGRVEKTYWAVVEGAPATDEGEIDMALGRLDSTRGWWMRPDPLGLPARTFWRALARGHDPDGREIAFLELKPRTGRTHQLRVHCQAMGWPILGDPVYGHGKREGAPPLHLHARGIVVPMRDNREGIAVTAPAPPHMRPTLEGLGWGLEEERA